MRPYYVGYINGKSWGDVEREREGRRYVRRRGRGRGGGFDHWTKNTIMYEEGQIEMKSKYIT